MNVVVPYVPGQLRAETVAAVAEVPFAYADVGGGDDHYWRLLRRLWAEGSFAIVEQDVVPHPGAIAELVACPYDWCAFPYRMEDIVATALGCTKFGATLTARHAELVETIPSYHRGWVNLDSMVVGALHRAGEREHVHQPEVRHLHERATRGKEAILTVLRYVGSGERYLHEDASAGIPPIPPTDFTTDDPRVVDICVQSGLYVVGRDADTGRRGKGRAPAAADTPTEDEAATTAEPAPSA